MDTPHPSSAGLADWVGEVAVTAQVDIDKMPPDQQARPILALLTSIFTTRTHQMKTTWAMETEALPSSAWQPCLKPLRVYPFVFASGLSASEKGSSPAMTF